MPRMTVVAFSESISPNVLQNVAAVADPHVTVRLDDVIVPAFANRVFACIGVGTTLDRVKLVSPRLRKITNVEVTPVNRGATTPSTPPAYQDFSANPIELDVNEALNAQALQSAAAAERETIVVFLTDEKPTPVEGKDIRSVRATSTTTLTANAWTNGSLTFEETLPAGKYQIIGMRVESSGLIAARLVLVGEAFRPGCVGVNAASDIEANIFRMGRLGVWGEFDHNTPPTVDFLSSTADTSETVVLDLIKLS